MGRRKALQYISRSGCAGLTLKEFYDRPLGIQRSRASSQANMGEEGVEPSATWRAGREIVVGFDNFWCTISKVLECLYLIYQDL